MASRRKVWENILGHWSSICRGEGHGQGPGLGRKALGAKKMGRAPGKVGLETSSGLPLKGTVAP